jgi:hypothetical protein
MGTVRDELILFIAPFADLSTIADADNIAYF